MPTSVDVSRLEENLALTPTERIRRMVRFLNRPGRCSVRQPADFEAILTALDAAGVEFLVIDGLALVVHGGSRATVDVDLAYRRSDENLQRLARARSKRRIALAALDVRRRRAPHCAPDLHKCGSDPHRGS